jgi:hypothetical protein
MAQSLFESRNNLLHVSSSHIREWSCKTYLIYSIGGQKQGQPFLEMAPHTMILDKDSYRSTDNFCRRKFLNKTE